MGDVMENKLDKVIASRLNKLPNSKVDHVIIQHANSVLKQKTNYITFGLSLTSFAMMLLLIVNVGRMQVDSTIPKGSEEMVVYYQEMEVMASLGELNDNDLESILKE